MPIPSEIQSIMDRLDRELGEIEREATEGLNLVRPILSKRFIYVTRTNFGG